MINMSLNVLKYSFRPRYYLTNPLSFFKETWQNLRAAWWRITKGYAPVDVWNWNTWFLEITPPMLRMMADKGMGYAMDTPEQWNNWLHSVADVLESLQEENWESRNEFAEDFFRLCEHNRQVHKNEHGDLCVTWSSDAEYKEIAELWRIREEELIKEWNVLAEDTLRDIGRYLACLWD